MTASSLVTTVHTPSLTCGCPACVAAYLSGLETKGSSAAPAATSLGSGSLLAATQAAGAASLFKAAPNAPASAAPATNTAASATVGTSLPTPIYTGVMPDGLTPAIYLQALLAGGNYWWQANGGSTVPTATNGLTGAAHSLTYSFMTSDYAHDTGSVGFAAMGPNEQAAVNAALAYISSIFDITFTQVAAGTGQINYGTNDQGSESAAYSQYANSDAGKANVMISNDATYGYGEGSSYAPGTYAWEVLLHETGHALGLKHPGNYNATGGGTSGPYLPADMDDRQYSIMSYNNASNSINLSYTAYINPSTYQLYDFYALQYLYGANTGATSPQNQDFSWSPNAYIYQTLYATGANNWIDLSNQTLNSVINLNPGTFSSIDENGAGYGYYNGVNNLAIAPNAQIDTVYLGAGTTSVTANNDGDTIVLGTGTALIVGGTGDDTFDLNTSGGNATIYGFGGTDVAVVADQMSDYSVAYSNGIITLTRGSVTDTLVGFTGVDFNGTWYLPSGAQGLIFAVKLPEFHTFVSPNFSLALNAMVAADDTAAASGLTYTVTDNGGAGHFFVNGVEQANYTPFSVNALQLSETTYIAAAGGLDQITVSVSDGSVTKTKTFSIASVAAVAPTITLHPVSGLYVPQSIGFNSTFSVVDHNNFDASTLTYTVMDTGGAGYFSVNGVTEANYTPFTLTAGLLAATSYVALNGGTDIISLTVSDGVSSTSTSFTISSTNYPGPVVTPVHAAITASDSQTFLVSDLFKTTDPNPKLSPTFYQIELSDAPGGNGLLSWDEVTLFKADTVLTFNATNLELLEMQYTIYTGQEKLFIRASDGTTANPHWGAWTTITITAPPEPQPSFAHLTVSVPDDSSVSGTSFVSLLSGVEGPDTYYEFMDPAQVTGKDPAGSLALNGVAQGDFTVDPANLSEVSFIGNRSGAGLTTTIEFRVALGGTGNWGNWNVDTIKVVDLPPVVTPAAPQTATRDQIFTANDLFSGSDPVLGQTISQYELYASDLSGADGILLNGVLQTNDTGIFVSAGDLGTVTFQSITGTDILYVRANDGTAANPHWGAWATITVTAPAATIAAVFTPTSATTSATHNETFSTSSASSPLSLFSVADASGGTIQQYEFFDNDSAGGTGYLLMNGQALKNDTVDLVSAANLNEISYMAVSGSEVIAVRANDGTLAHPVWGAWSLVTVTVPTAVVAPNNATITPNHDQLYSTTNAASPLSLFTATDPGGGTIQQYEVFDNDTSGGTGYFLMNGAILANDTVQLVSAANMSLLSYMAISGTQLIAVRANDGTAAHPIWGAWGVITATVPTAVVAPNNATITPNRDQLYSTTNAASPLSLFTATDPSGGTIQQYEVFDNDTSGGAGYFVMNGTILANDTVQLVSAANMTSLSYMAIAGTELIAVRANDGTAAHPIWGAWGVITVTAPPTTTAASVAPASASVSASHNQLFTTTLASSPLTLFNETDLSGGTIQQYEFFDNDSSGGTGNLLMNGNVLKNDTVQLVKAADLTTISYRAVSGTQVIALRANDGTVAHPVWGAWGLVTVTVPTAAPVGSAIPIPPLATAGSITALPSTTQSIVSPASLLANTQQSLSPLVASHAA